MRPRWCTRLMSSLDESDRRAAAVAATLTTELLNRPPASGGWSIGQCLEHLAVANDVYLDAIGRALSDNAPDGPVDEIELGRPTRWFIRNYIEPSESIRRAKAPRKIRPAASVDSGVVDRLLQGNARARKLLVRASSYDVNRVRFRNPFVPLLRFTIGGGFEILTRHQHRHLLQAERLRASAGFGVGGVAPQ